MIMNLYKFEVSNAGKITANGADCNGTFYVRGKVDPFYLQFNANKIYPDHSIFLWGQAMTSKITDDVVLSALDQFNGSWGFENGV